MGYINSTPEDDLNLDVTARVNPIQQITPNNWYDGIAGAVPRGVANAFLKTNEALNEVMAPVDKFLGIEEINKAMSVDIPKSLEQWAKPDARYQAAPAQIIQSVTEGLGLAATGAALGGPMGAAAMLGGVEGHATYQDQRKAGVDPETALKTAGVVGMVNALGVFLPMAVTKSAVIGIAGRAMAAEAAGNTALARALFALSETAAPVAGKVSSSIALGVGTNILTGMAQRGLTGEILRDNGYKEMADQYRVWDAQSMIADVVLGAAFGGFAHLTSADRVPPSMVDDAMAVKKREHFDRAGLGIPTNPLAANVHNDVMGRSIEDLILGKPEANLTAEQARAIADNIVTDPEIGFRHSQQFNDLASVYGAADELGEPALLPEKAVAPLTPELTPVGIQVGKAGEEAPSAQIDLLKQETLNQLVARNPGMAIQLGDGREVRVADLPSILEKDMASAKKDSLLHDIAAACYIRTTS